MANNDSEFYPDGVGSLQRAFNRYNDVDYDKGGIGRIMSYTIINSEFGEDTSYLNDKANGKDFVSICMKSLSTMSYTCYELAMVKVEGLKVTDKLETYLQPLKPVSKALRKVVPDGLMAEIEKAPTFKDMWAKIEPFLGSQVIVGAESSERRFTYCADYSDIKLPVMAYIGCRGSQPFDVKRLVTDGKPMDNRSALDYAMEWSANMIEDKG